MRGNNMNSKDRTYDELDKKILTATISLMTNILYNDYALENIILNKIIPGTPIPYDLYLEELKLKPYETFLDRKNIEGAIINEEEKIRNKPIQDYFVHYFIGQVNDIFIRAPKHKQSKQSKESETILPFKYGLQNYLEELYPLYEQIITEKVEPNFYDLISAINSQKDILVNNKLSQRFIAAIKINKLRQGSRIDRYIKDIQHPSDLVKKLFYERGGHYILINNDSTSIDYKLALISCFSFHTAENQNLLELKIKKWKENNK